jgi:hypothetical protein
MRCNSRILLALGVGIVLGKFLFDGALGDVVAPPAHAESAPLAVADGMDFVSTDGPNAYLWQRAGDRLVLIGQCSRTPTTQGAQATFVWLPGVERAE